MNTEQAPQWLSPYLIPFFTLSYPTAVPANPDSFPDSSYYTTGLLDGCLLITLIAIMAVLRDVLRLWVLEPFAKWKLTRDLRLRASAKQKKANGNGHNGVSNGNGKANGASNGEGKSTAVANENGRARRVVSNSNGHSVGAQGVIISRREAKKMHRSVIRFAEQGWPVVYYTFVWSFGLYVHSNLPTRILDPIDVWLNYPHIPIAGPVKLYYSLNTAFYMHQILIINAEAHRQDHWQMMTHHVITIFLMIGSYFYNYTRIGCLIMLIMDWCDIFLPLAKMFRYLSFTRLCDATFVFFMLSWVTTRHVLFLLAIKSTWSALDLFPSIWAPERSITTEVHVTFLSMLITLQFIQIWWFWRICLVAWRVVSGQGAEDNRSDDEDDDGSSGNDLEKDE
ncbi:uncharacterized protein FIBRA_06220 [Fibroporia radiculosa]|uniref:TLC domain-containing protein n=1 Tax=Fibroporia radiculosa TaxID=599839 RepID=J4IB53_9APHY|nr:uncharacterized protein FIBRA_06220 [Fibroporia radiculosa]CCM04061.1 predicted protein [Fibroporia radiculosa]